MAIHEVITSCVVGAGGLTAPHFYIKGVRMLSEFALVGVAIAAILLFIGFLNNERRIHLLVAGSIILIITGLFIAADTSGIEVQTYGGCMNASYENSYVWNDTCTVYEHGESVTSVVNCTRDQYNITYTYGPCYHHSLGFNFSQAIAIMIMLVGIGIMLGTFLYARKGDPFKE